MSELYTYAVARVRAMEDSLFSDGIIEQLINCKDERQALTFLEEKGWGSGDGNPDAEVMLQKEEEKTWSFIDELGIDKKIFDVYTLPKCFHNLKAAIKAVGLNKEDAQFFYEDEHYGQTEMLQIIREKSYEDLPEMMREVASEGYEAFMQTGDGQLLDVIIDRATLEAILEAGKKTKEPLIESYAETTVAVANIKIAVRSEATKKNLGFVERALAPCKTLDVTALAKATQINRDAIIDYLSGTIYKEGGEALAESASVFERWCDNQMIATIAGEKYNPFTIGPVFAYVIARQNEIKTVRIILSGIRNDLPEKEIRERVRRMYV
ncbi:V/A-type H+-transporting ATPase subunit C [Lachnospiraceae bacterium PM6-15]|uniref:V-type ATPase subunit n=1 Tax=Ohessyouella blattaphilus TaxID=2949333 RepID=A0ABT1ENY1_9FIRM|nr:V-type ATPase subunit [Ohessyouella blattaphilus]MCP1110987.1 V-type ATPase subunit [Ohessyouella blattaphilus]MCR8564381.1 V-type ATPase subunit [Ohessyouella blattaphilus]MDL2249802.1 V-type ATPase subunit [Lachnospiraceae bacterium OttesenSCG-928-J05]